jgi:hypothetical protein
VPPGVSHHQSSSQFSSPSYGQYSPTPARLPQAYAPNLPELSQPGAAPEPVEDPEFGQPQINTAALDDAYNQYQNALKRTFQNMRDGRLGEAGTSLLTISDWLLSNAVELGMWKISLIIPSPLSFVVVLSWSRGRTKKTKKKGDFLVIQAEKQ